jgi:hypothetical protein
MKVTLVLITLFVGLAIGLSIPRVLPRSQQSPEPARTRHILLPFTSNTLTRRALEAAIRLARAEHATLMPAFLATVPLTLPIESPLPRQTLVGMPLLEAIEQRASASGIAVDSRVQAGRTYRHALARLLEHEPVDRVIVSATDGLRTGLSGPDLIWLLTHTNAEVMILKPAPQDCHVLLTDTEATAFQGAAETSPVTTASFAARRRRQRLSADSPIAPTLRNILPSAGHDAVTREA